MSGLYVYIWSLIDRWKQQSKLELEGPLLEGAGEEAVVVVVVVGEEDEDWKRSQLRQDKSSAPVRSAMDVCPEEEEAPACACAWCAAPRQHQRQGRALI
jgi:hypothetical protein